MVSVSAWKLRFLLNDYGIPTVTGFGKWWAPWLPANIGDDQGVHIVFGKPIPCPKIETPNRPTQQEVHSFML